MKLIKNLKKLRAKFPRPVLTIGIFDGVHLGHQRIIREVLRRAKILNGTSIILTFSPHPLKVIRHPQATSLITSLEHRID
ncbi:MAG: adenylyltransferase/cytidyltransferase family protein, partial [Candidatus Omnitrophica bacterium]|nr:adenylyltransferase/cytidyltransferase family protein [Candidatus Omnitrophota bacterium]